LSNAPSQISLAEEVPGDIASALAKMRERGFEGLILKARGSVYEKGRSREWLKLKAQATQELAIVGWTPGKGNARGALGALPLAVADKKPEECVREKPAPVPTATPAKGRARKQTPAPAPDQPQKLTNPDRLLYPKDRITKADVAAYYDAVAPALLNALRGRPLTLVHWNQGIEKPSWFHQDVGAMAEDWMRTVETPART